MKAGMSTQIVASKIAKPRSRFLIHRLTMLPGSLVEPLKSHLQLVKLQHERDCEQGCGQVYLPFALDRKHPNAPAEWKWQYVFPANRLSTDPRSGDLRRHHIEEQKVQRAVPWQRRTPAYSRK